MSADIRYAKRDGSHLAYRVDGDGPVTLLYLRTATSSVDSLDEEIRLGTIGVRITVAQVSEAEGRHARADHSLDWPLVRGEHRIVATTSTGARAETRITVR